LLAIEPASQEARVPVRQRWLPGGDVGVLQTVNAMRDVVRASLAAPVVRLTAEAAVEGATDPVTQWRLLRNWLATHTQFLADPPNLELVRTPVEQLRRIARDGIMRGDCDDVATLAAALTLALGRPARFAVLGFFQPGPATPYRHIFTEMQTAPDVWRDFDVTRRPGSLPASRRMTLPV